MAWSQEQLSNASTIISVGRGLGASDRDIIISLMTAMQESGLRNLNYGDRDSIGLFQQRDAWGTREQRLNPAESARMFFLGGHAGQRGLLDFGNRNEMSLTQAAQAVQVSAFPDAYAKWEDEARGLAGNPDLPDSNTTTTQTTLGQVPGMDALLAEPEVEYKEMVAPNGRGIEAIEAEDVGLGDNTELDDPLDALETTEGEGVDPKIAELKFDNASPIENPMYEVNMPDVKDLFDKAQGGGVNTGGSTAAGWRGSVEDLARKFLGTPYVWGGTSPSGFDCSGLIQFIFAQQGIKLPRISADQARAGRRVGLNDLRVGDLVAWDNSSRNNGADHIALYIGNGLIIEAPRPGSAVQVNGLYDTGNAWGVALDFD